MYGNSSISDKWRCVVLSNAASILVAGMYLEKFTGKQLVKQMEYIQKYPEQMYKNRVKKSVETYFKKYLSTQTLPVMHTLFTSTDGVYNS